MIMIVILVVVVVVVVVGECLHLDLGVDARPGQVDVMRYVIICLFSLKQKEKTTRKPNT